MENLTPPPELMQEWPPAFHPAPYEQISTHVPDPREFVNELYRTMLEARPYFPGDTNYIGHCLDAVLEQLENAGATTEFDDD